MSRFVLLATSLQHLKRIACSPHRSSPLSQQKDCFIFQKSSALSRFIKSCHIIATFEKNSLLAPQVISSFTTKGLLYLPNKQQAAPWYYRVQLTPDLFIEKCPVVNSSVSLTVCLIKLNITRSIIEYFSHKPIY